MKRILLLTLYITALAPLVSSAAVSGLGDLIGAAKTIVYLLIPLAAMLAIIYFFWGVTEYVRKSSEGDVAEGRSKMLWGIIGLFVIFAISGILVFFQSDLGFGTGSSNSGKQTIFRAGVGVNPEGDVGVYGSKPEVAKKTFGERLKSFFTR